MKAHDPDGADHLSRADRLALAALGFILVVTVAWWTLALWPVPGETPEWLARAREVCFNATGTGLPDASGWMLLVGQPLSMTAALAVIWKESVVSGLVGLARSGAGRSVLFLTGLFLVAGLVASGVRVVQANESAVVRLGESDVPPEAYPRLDRAAPTTELVDQNGRRTGISDLRGRAAFVTFAFGHCETVCPLVVRNALEARRRLERTDGPRSASGIGTPASPVLVVITLDPWRDTPGRLSHMAEKWGLSGQDRVLGGTVEEVEAALDAWGVARSRDEKTGDIVHPPLVYLLDGEARIAFAGRGDVSTLVALAERMQGERAASGS